MPNITITLLVIILLVSVSLAQQIKQHTLIAIKQSVIKHQDFSNITIVSSLNHLAVFSFSSKLTLSSPNDLHGKRIVIINPISSTTDVYDEDSDLLVRELSLTETTFKSQLELYNKKIANQSQIIVPKHVDTFDFIFYDCVYGNPLDNYDIFVMSSEDFLQSFVSGIPKKMEKNGLYEWNDFSFLKEFQVPISVSVYYNQQQTNLNETVVSNQIDTIYRGMSELYFSNSNTTNYELYRNFGYMFYSNGYGNITQYEREFITYYLTQYNDVPMQKKPSVQFYSFSSDKYSKEYENSAMNIFKQSTSVMTINAMYCYEKFNDQFTICSGIYLTSNVVYDAINLVTIIIGLLFYMALISVSNTKSIKRRLTAPYILPILVIICNICFSSYTNTCKSVKSVFIVCSIAGVIGVYGFSLLRFTYLRYLYIFLSKTTGSVSIKIHKILVSTTFGIVGSLSFGFGYAIMWLCICVPYVNNRLYASDTQIALNIMYVVEVLSGTLIGTIIILLDSALNWKRIKERGIYNFLTFEDPFGLRLDLIYFFFIIVATVSITIISPFPFDYQDVVIGLLKAMAFIFTYMLAGGTAILIEWKRAIKGFFLKKRSVISLEKDETVRFEELMKDELFRDLFEMYCSKEFSLENALLYAELQTLKEVHQQDDLMPFDSFKKLYETYFQSLSKYEVNLPSPVKKQLYSFYELQESVNFSKVYDLVRTELLFNLNDTFERLKETSEFKRYSFSRDVQLKNSIV